MCEMLEESFAEEVYEKFKTETFLIKSNFCENKILDMSLYIILKTYSREIPPDSINNIG